LAAAGVTVTALLFTVVKAEFVESDAVRTQLLPSVIPMFVNAAVPFTAGTLVVPVSVHVEVRTIVSVRVVAPPEEVTIATFG
jgi:hypothetical protein